MLVAFAGYVVFAASLSGQALAATQIGTTTYSSNTAWTTAGSPYVVNGNVTVASGVTLTIQPGVIVKFNGTLPTINVNGSLSAVGTSANHVVFTSLQDDSVGGDTGGDGLTTGAPGQWSSISVNSSATATLSYADVRYGGYGSISWNYGAIDLYGSGATASVDHSTLSYNQDSAVLVGLNASATLSADTISNNANGVSVNGGTVALQNRTFVAGNSSDGVWFNLSATAPVSTVNSSDVANNGNRGIYIQAGSISTSQYPHGNKNNIYGNTNKQLDVSAYPVPKNSSAVDWSGNYWGADVYYYYNPTDCLSASPNASGHLAFHSSGSSPPDGPVANGAYLVSEPYPQPSLLCAYDYFNIDATRFSPTYIDGGPSEPLAQSWGDCGVDNQADVEALNQTSCEQAVDAGSGGLNQSVTDLSLAGIGVPFAFTRTYNSLDRTPGPLGRGWTFSYGAQLGVLANGDVNYRSGTGQQIYFTKQGSSYLGAPGSRCSLTLSGGVYDLLRSDQLHERFDSSGRLTSIKDRNNQGLSFIYNGSSQLTTITDSVGRTITLTYDVTSGLVTGVALPDGRAVSYAYTNGLLSTVTDARGGTTTYTYETHGWLAKAVDPLSHTIFENTYGSDGRVLTQKDGLGKTTSYSWDPTTQIETTTDPRGKTWKDVYANGLVVKRIDPVGDAVQYGYDADLNQTRVTDALGNQTTMTFDSAGNMLTRTAPSPLSYQETWTYNSFNDPLSYTDGRGKTTSYGYDSAGNLTSKTQPGSITTQYGRDPGGTGLLVSSTDPRGKTTSYGYDASGNQTSITTPLGEKTTMAYDSSGRMTSRVDPRGNVTGANPADYTTSFTYNNADQKLTQTDPLGHTTTSAYDAAGNLSSLTDANSHTTSYAYDADNRLTSVTAPGSATTSYAYDDNGNVTSRTDPNSHVTSYSYDDANRQTGSTDPLSRSWSYSYDANGNRTTVTNPASGVTSYGYDVLDRLTSISYSDSTPTVTFAYDGDGNRSQMVDGAGTVNYSYDDLNRLTAATRGTNTFSYGYDNAGNLTSRTYPGSTNTSYSFDDDERLASLTSGGATTSYAYDAAGNLTQTTRPSGNGWNETRTYDHAGQLIELKDANGISTLQQLDYAYDPAGNATSLIRAGGGVEYYQYDNRDRLTKVCYSAVCASATDTIAWTYDSVGNRLTETRPSGTTTYAYDSADELTQTSGPGGTTNYSYDTSGNETAAGTRTFSYDLASRPISTSSAGTTTAYSYDGDGNRLTGTTGSITTNYLWDTNNSLPQLAIERDGSGNPLRTYIQGRGTVSMLTGGNTYYFHYERLGSIAAVTSSSGATEWTYTYEPFGTPRTTTKVDPTAPTNPIQYNDQYQDPVTSLLDLRARQYDTGTGRFLGTDPKPAAPTAPYEASYVYAGNDPVDLTDPSGLNHGPGYPCEGLSGARLNYCAYQRWPYAEYCGRYPGEWSCRHSHGHVSSRFISCTIFGASLALGGGEAVGGLRLLIQRGLIDGLKEASRNSLKAALRRGSLGAGGNVGIGYVLSQATGGCVP